MWLGANFSARIAGALPGVISRMPAQQPKLFLTFDDGPHPEITPRVLELLEKYSALASFFLVGENAEKYPAVLSSLLSKNHTIGNHTYQHLNGWKTSLNMYLHNIEKAAQFYDTNLFRPPYGKMTLQQYRAVKQQYRIVLWTCLTEDFNAAKSQEQILRKSERAIAPGAILLFHDSPKAQKNLLFVLPRLLAFARERGYTFEALPS
jgi:peptidoglycan/xylan/chitin deacetylase (PgdA/CDA1 family)